MSELITVSTLDEKLKEIDVAFNKVVQDAVLVRDEQIRLRGEHDAITKLKAELEKEEKKET